MPPLDLCHWVCFFYFFAAGGGGGSAAAVSLSASPHNSHPDHPTLPLPLQHQCACLSAGCGCPTTNYMQCSKQDMAKLEWCTPCISPDTSHAARWYVCGWPPVGMQCLCLLVKWKMGFGRDVPLDSAGVSEIRHYSYVLSQWSLALAVNGMAWNKQARFIAIQWKAGSDSGPFDNWTRLVTWLRIIWAVTRGRLFLDFTLMVKATFWLVSISWSSPFFAFRVRE